MLAAAEVAKAAWLAKQKAFAAKKEAEKKAAE